MEYIDAWETSIKMIKYCYRAYNLYEWHLPYDDFYQECALCFWGQLKPKFDALNSLNICSKAYRWVALNSLKKQQNFYKPNDNAYIFTIVRQVFYQKELPFLYYNTIIHSLKLVVNHFC